MSTIMNDDNKVLIIGAGIGGLTLAQGLRKQGIPFEIFERDAEQGSRAQGWAVALVEALDLLPDYLPNDLGDILGTSVNAGTHEPDVLGILDMDTGKVTGYLGDNNARGEKHSILRASRNEFRNYLWQHIAVRTSRHYSHYSTSPTGSVTAHFKDGTSTTGAILVGADGASSHVRSQLLGPVLSKAQFSNFIPIVGQVTLTREQYEPISAISNSGFIGGHDHLRMTVGRLTVEPDGSSARYFWIVCYHSDNPEADAAWAHKASKQELFDKAMSFMDHLPPNVRYVIPLAGKDSVVNPPLRFLEFVPPEHLPRGRVTLLGDSAHSMVPFRARGANTACEDAVDLARLIVQQAQVDDTETPQSWEDVLWEYAEAMTVRGAENVLASRHAGEQLQYDSVLDRPGTGAATQTES